jgi:hypothetical protein
LGESGFRIAGTFEKDQLEILLSQGATAGKPGIVGQAFHSTPASKNPASVPLSPGEIFPFAPPLKTASLRKFIF